MSGGYVFCDGFHLPAGVFAPRPHVPIISIEVVIKDCETRRRSHCVVIVIEVVVVVVDVVTMANHPFARILTAPEDHRATVYYTYTHIYNPKICVRVYQNVKSPFKNAIPPPPPFFGGLFDALPFSSGLWSAIEGLHGQIQIE